MVLLTLTSGVENSENFEVSYNVPIDVTTNTKVALIGVNLWFSWYNISHEYKNNIIQHFDGSTWRTTVLPDGFYTIDLLNDTLMDTKIGFDINKITSRAILNLKSGGQVDFSEGKLHKVLGFESKIYTSDKTEGTYPINISNDIDRILIHCSLVDHSYLNNVKSDVIYSFVPETPPGSLITLNPNPSIYLPIREREHINSIRMNITDQNNRPIELNNERVTYILHLKNK